MSIDRNMSVDEALRRYKVACDRVRDARIIWNGVTLRIEGGSEYVAAFEQLQASRAAANRPWTPADR